MVNEVITRPSASSGSAVANDGREPWRAGGGMGAVRSDSVATRGSIPRAGSERIRDNGGRSHHPTQRQLRFRCRERWPRALEGRRRDWSRHHDRSDSVAPRGSIPRDGGGMGAVTTGEERGLTLPAAPAPPPLAAAPRSKRCPPRRRDARRRPSGRASRPGRRGRRGGSPAPPRR